MSSVLQIYVRGGEGGYEIEASYNGASQQATATLPRDIKRSAAQVGLAVATGANVRGLLKPSKKQPVKPDDNIMQEIGEDLFRFLFQPRLYPIFERAMDAATSSAVRISLNLQSKDLAQFPWETLWNPDTQQYLTMNAKMPFARGLQNKMPIVADKLPVRILFMISTPEELDGHGLAPINDDAEWVAIKAALDPLVATKHVEYKRVDSGNFRDLILTASAGFDVFHFIGHGDVDPDGLGYLVFSEDGKFGRKVYADDVRDCLESPSRTPRLAVLNACKSASSVGRDRYRNTAQTLATRIPAVIGMQYDFTSAAAWTFSKEFYAGLCTGQPIQEALRIARLILRQNGPEWITPVLYFGGDDGVMARRADA